jgi:hypothetical protein
LGLKGGASYIVYDDAVDTLDKIDGALEEKMLSSEDMERILGVVAYCPLGWRGGNGGGASESIFPLSPLNDRSGAGVKETVRRLGSAEELLDPEWFIDEV